MKNFSLLLITLMILATISCTKKDENEALNSKIDSLNTVLADQQLALGIMTEVGNMLDSIDASRKSIFVEMEQGTSYSDYVSRMKDLNSYIISTEKKLAGLEANLTKASKDNKWLGGQIRKLKEELEKKNAETLALQEQVEQYKTENTNLVNINDIQKSKLEELDERLLAKSAELEAIEARIRALMAQAVLNDADSYFARATALELAASRTKLAPKRKKETLAEALSFYEKALELGKTEAAAKIEELKDKM
jgi:uncharacterized coiled-coil protein SlyX